MTSIDRFFVMLILSFFLVIFYFGIRLAKAVLHQFKPSSHVKNNSCPR